MGFLFVFTSYKLERQVQTHSFVPVVAPPLLFFISVLIHLHLSYLDEFVCSRLSNLFLYILQSYSSEIWNMNNFFRFNFWESLKHPETLLESQCSNSGVTSVTICSEMESRHPWQCRQWGRALVSTCHEPHWLDLQLKREKQNSEPIVCINWMLPINEFEYLILWITNISSNANRSS